MVVGLLPFAAYEATSVTLEAGDLLIAYTDGVSEAMTVDDEEWGEERMLLAVPDSARTAAEILETISVRATNLPPEPNNTMT